MLDPVDLQLFPSCYNCLSWSADGELVLAAGEHVHILTPRTAKERAKEEIPAGEDQWHSSRFRVNVFNSSEWPIIDAQPRETFSIGAEQSLSTVSGLAWSPPGLAKHRQCLLAVLTSNLILSFYEVVGPQRKWARVGVVNRALTALFEPIVHEQATLLRKTKIRSFAWFQPLKVPGEEGGASYSIPDAESRWGVHLLAVANDDNDVVFLRVHRSKSESDHLNSYTIDILSRESLAGLGDNYPMVNPGSVFHTTLQKQLRISTISCGPWLRAAAAKNQDTYILTSNVAVSHGTQLRTIRFDVQVTHRDQGSGSGFRYELVGSSEQNTHSLSGYCQVTGPLEWAHTDGFSEVVLTGGITAGLFAITIPISLYLGNNTTDEEIQAHEWSLCNQPGNEARPEEDLRHWEPMSALCAAMNPQTQQQTLYLSTTGGFGATKPLNDSSTTTYFSQAPWNPTIDNYCDQFDIERDLGGMVTARIWGMAVHGGLIAVAFSVHPIDMVEYRTGAEDRLVVAFAPLDGHGDEESVSEGGIPDASAEALRAKREGVLAWILHAGLGEDGNSLLSKKVIYAAACCVIIESDSGALLAQAQKSLESLSRATGRDLGEELSKCVSGANTIEAKPATQLDGPGEGLFERCDICNAGIGWYSAAESQCANGHLFVRCNTTFLSIQEPGISKFCVDCGTEYLNEDFVDSLDSSDGALRCTCKTVAEAFDVCIYCGGKFRS